VSGHDRNVASIHDMTTKRAVMSFNPDQVELQRAWDANAAFWDDCIGAEGNDFHRVLVAPAQIQLLALSPGERVVELACGNGQFSREMARGGVEVVACDFSAVFVARARAHAEQAGLAIDYRVADVTDAAQLMALGETASFDAAVCTMAFHDIAELGPVALALRSLVKPGGRFVFSVIHPCFNGSNPTFVAETSDEDGEIITRYSLKIDRYRDRQPERGIGILGQPEPHWYFPRTLTELLSLFFDAGWTMDGVQEPAFPPDLTTPTQPPSWTDLSAIPPVFVVRLRPVNKAPNRQG
jgi:2-polyprenyl-3-methyl-5-hydroxy-6-metoxy-1,4-benzoquinol methylase